MSRDIGSRYIGSTLPEPGRFFYKLTRADDGYLTLTKYDLVADNDTIVINDLILRNDQENQLDFDFGSNMAVYNVDENHEIINKAAGHVQIKVSADDLHYFIDDNGYLVLRFNNDYEYPENP